MKHVGPPLEVLLHRLTSCPAELYEHASQSPRLITALVADYFRQSQAELDRAALQRLLPVNLGQESQWMPLIVWLVSLPWFMSRSELQTRIAALFTNIKLKELAKLVKLEMLVNDPDRREELVRIVLAALDLRPEGETKEQALDRLNTLDSVERKRILLATLDAEKRAREVREAMARAKAQESASRYGE